MESENWTPQYDPQTSSPIAATRSSGEIGCEGGITTAALTPTTHLGSGWFNRKRKGAKEGPDTCPNPTSMKAINAAIETSESRPGEPVFFPHIGTVFCSCDEAKAFYNVYSWEMGFGIRESRGKKNKNDYTTRKDIVCSCEGQCPNPQSASMRTGCKAKIRLHRTSDHAWVVTEIVTEHNHPLSVTFGEKKQWGSHSFIDPMTKELIYKLRRNNVSLGRVCSIVGALCPQQEQAMRKQTIKDMCARIAQEDIKDDIKKTMALLNDLKQNDSEFDVRFKTSETGQIETMLWCTGKNKHDYKKYGDVVTFDTTYRTNLYNLPFGIFVGVNSHYQSIIFGGVLMDHERTEDFEWTFKNFLELMDGNKPQTILTDQCQGMAAAIKTTMQGTRHRWCRWHVLRGGKGKIGPAYSKRSTFKKKFNRLITHVVSASEFEATWSSLIEEYKLQENKFLDRAFKNRGMWAKPYFMDIFCAGMTSTQRSESANHMLKQFIQRAAPMHVFVDRFRELQFTISQEEDRQNFKTKIQSRAKRMGVPLEEHAEQIYTREMYNRFSKQLFESGAYTIAKRSENNKKFVVIHNNHLDSESRVEHTVLVDPPSKIICTCGLFEHQGLPCKHSLKVLMHLDIKTIPPGNIHHRWTRACSEEGVIPDLVPANERLAKQNNMTKRRMLIMKALELSQSKNDIDEEMLNKAISAMTGIIENSAHPAIELVNSQGDQASLPVEMSSATSNLSCPPRTKRTGRPRNTSLNSWKKHSKLEKDWKRSEDEQCPEDFKEDGVTNKNTRKLSDLLQVTPKK